MGKSVQHSLLEGTYNGNCGENKGNGNLNGVASGDGVRLDLSWDAALLHPPAEFSQVEVTCRNFGN